MRIGKILILVLGGLLALVVVVLVGVWAFVNPNDYKPRIVAAVKEATGRDLVLSGDLKLSVFPWVALELGPASLGNPPGFAAIPGAASGAAPDASLVSFKRASFRAKLLPLLSKRLEIGKVELDGLNLTLVKNSAGKGNWEGFGKSAANAPASDAQGGSGTVLQGIAGIKITDARVSYQSIVVDHLNIESGSFEQKGLVPVTVTFDVNRGVRGEKANIQAKLAFSGDFTAKTYRVAALNLNGAVDLAGNNRPVKWAVTAPDLSVDLAAQTLALPAFDATLAGAHLTGHLNGTRIVDALSAQGAVSLAPLVVREFMPRLGLTGPKTRDPKALSSIAADADFAYGGNAARLDHLKATLDETHLSGEVAVTHLDTQALEFNLAVDKIDVDRYLAPEGTQPAPAPKDEKPAAPSKPLNAHGTLTVGSIHFAPLDLTQVKLTVAANDGVIHVFPLRADIDGGQYSGNVTYDGRSTVPTLSMDEHLTGIDVGRLLAGTSKNLKVSGRGNVALKATGRGATADPLLRSLNGRLDANVAGGAVEGIDLGFELGRAEALLRKQPLPNTQNTHRTAFDALKMSADIANGIATTKDLTLSSTILKVTGAGSTNLVTKAIDFSLLADTLRTAGTTPIQIPVKITGTTADPTVRPDIEALAKGQLKQKVQEVLQDKLKGFFNRH